MRHRFLSQSISAAALGLVLAAMASCGGGDGAVGGGSWQNNPTGTAQPMTPGATIAADVSTKPAAGPQGGAGQLYTLTLSQQTNLRFELTANGFPPFLGLYEASGRPICERNASDFWFKAFLPAGTYQVFVSSMSNASGPFTLTSTLAQPSPCSDSSGTVTPLTTLHTVKGASLAGTITSADCGGGGVRTHIYEIRLNAGETIGVSLTTDKLSGFNIWGPPHVQLTGKEMAGAGSGSFTFTAPTTTYYTLNIESRTVGSVSSLPVTYAVRID